MPQATQASQRRRRAAAGAAGAAAVGAGVAATAPVPAAAAGSVGISVVVAGILSSFITWLSALREQHRSALVRELARFTSQPSDIARVVRQEMLLETQFAKASADRIAGKMPHALRIDDPAERERQVRQILSDEERYAAQRAEAMFARAIAALTRHDLRLTSPLGAFWRLGVARDHTEGCRFMAGWPGRDGRFWPWAVLDRVHPPRHYGCTSSLHGYGEAILAGWMTPSDVPDTKDAIRAAAGVVMELREAEALIAEFDIRAALLERGVDTTGIPFVGVSEAFEEIRHPRDWKGRFRTVGQVAEEMTARSLAWRDRNQHRGVSDDAPPREQIVKNWTRQVRGRLSQDRGAIGMIAAAQAQNRANPLYQRIVAAHVPDHVIVAKGAERASSLLDSMHGRPHRVAGTTVILDKSVREIGLEGTGKTPKDRPAASSGYGLSAVLRHEYGHSIDDELPRDVRRRILDAIPNPSEDLTYYAGMGGDQEVIPELIATITHPDYKASDWPETVREAERRLLNAIGVKRDGTTKALSAAE